MPTTAPQFLSLEAALEDLGVCWVLTGDPHTDGGLAVLGLTPGDVTPEMNPEFVERVYEEYSSQPLETKLKGYAPTVDVPLIWGDPAVYAKVSPLASATGGHTAPQPIVTTSLILVPDSEFQSDWNYDPTANTGAGAWVYPVGGPSHAVWFPKGFFEGAFPTFGSLNTENKNRVGSITFRGMLQDSADWPEGTKSYVIGDPVAAGVTNIDV